MKCPCCNDGSQDADMLVHNGKIYFSDGTSVKIRAGMAQVLTELLAGPLPTSKENSTSRPIQISRLREVFVDLGLPYKIVANRETHRYHLVKKASQ
jgi:hypothetical protein